MMTPTTIIDNIREVAKRVLPKGSTLYLYGSRARGDNRIDSDWDLLILLDKKKIEQWDRDNIAFPFVEMGWDVNADIRPHTYTKDQWFNGIHAMFYDNVEADKKVLYES